MDENKAFRTITLKVRFTGFQTYTRAKSLRFATSSKEAIVEGIRALATEFRNHPKKVRLVGVRLSGLEKEKAGKHIANGTLDSFAATSP
jgi:DNA polymerase-4